MNDTQPDPVQQPAESTQPTGIARRRLLRAGLAAGPVVLAMSGRSAMAGQGCAKGLSPLAWNSLAPTGNCVMTSHTVNTNVIGKSPAVWSGTSTWPISKTTVFQNIFTGTAYYGAPYKSKSFSTILSSYPSSIEAYLVAAYLNVINTPNYAMTATEVQEAYAGKIGTKGSVSLADMQGFLAQTW